MEQNRPRRTLWVNPDIFERAQPDFARDHIFSLASYNPLAPINPGATSWMAIPIEVPHFQAYLETNREYVDGYLLRGVTIFTATHGPWPPMSTSGWMDCQSPPSIKQRGQFTTWPQR